MLNLSIKRYHLYCPGLPGNLDRVCYEGVSTNIAGYALAEALVNMSTYCWFSGGWLWVDLVMCVGRRCTTDVKPAIYPLQFIIG